MPVSIVLGLFLEPLLDIVSVSQSDQIGHFVTLWATIKVDLYYGDYRSKLVHFESLKNVFYV